MKTGKIIGVPRICPKCRTTIFVQDGSHAKCPVCGTELMKPDEYERIIKEERDRAAGTGYTYLDSKTRIMPRARQRTADSDNAVTERPLAPIIDINSRFDDDE